MATFLFFQDNILIGCHYVIKKAEFVIVQYLRKPHTNLIYLGQVCVLIWIIMYKIPKDRHSTKEGVHLYKTQLSTSKSVDVLNSLNLE